MSYDLVLCGVGGQGVLSIASVIDRAAVEAGFHLKQPEVHGMAQRGGAVSAHVRISGTPIWSDLIAEGTADMVLALEPLEALRHTRLLRCDGWIVTDITPLPNMAGYPAPEALFDVLFAAPRVIAVDATRLAHRAGTVKARNTVMLGAAASRLPVPAALLEKHLRAVLVDKGPRVVAANVDAFRMGEAASDFGEALLAGGVAPGVVARVVASLGFEPEPLAQAVIAEWSARLAGPQGPELARRMFASREAHLDASAAHAD